MHRIEEVGTGVQRWAFAEGQKAAQADNEALELVLCALPYRTLSRLRQRRHGGLEHGDMAVYCLEQPCAAITEVIGKRAKAAALLVPEEAHDG